MEINQIALSNALSCPDTMMVIAFNADIAVNTMIYKVILISATFRTNSIEKYFM